MKHRVRLICDLTSYDYRLVVGSMGWTCPYAHAKWGIIVDYDCGVRLDTLWRSLEEDEEATAQVAQEAEITELQRHADILYRVHGMGKRDLQKLMSRVVDEARAADKAAAKASRPTAPRSSGSAC